MKFVKPELKIDNSIRFLILFDIGIISMVVVTVALFYQIREYLQTTYQTSLTLSMVCGVIVAGLLVMEMSKRVKVDKN